MARRTKKPQPRARCWFCDAEGVTQEHILARQLTKLFMSAEAEITIPDDRPRFRHDYERPDRPGVRRTKRAKWLAETTRKFCRTCNSGWMKDVDHAALPMLKAFVSNEPVTLDADQQQRLALWLTKVLLAYQSKERPELRCIDRSFYRELHKTRAPLQRSQLWLGANTHGQVAFASFHTLVFPENLPEETRGFGASLSFGYANFHIIFHGSDVLGMRLRSPLAETFSPLWPARPEIAWPPRLRISDRDISWLANDFNGRSEFVSVAELHD